MSPICYGKTLVNDRFLISIWWVSSLIVYQYLSPADKGKRTKNLWLDLDWDVEVLMN